MKKTLIFIAFIFFGNATAIFSQDSLAIGKVEYILETDLVESAHNRDGLSTLYFNKNISIFIHNDVPKKDKYEERGLIIKITFGDPDGFPLFINNRDSTFTQKVNKDAILIDTFEQTAWNIIADTSKVIGGYTCFLAKGWSYGRIYDVWFCPQFPFNAGPYKLRGLPGVIFEAESQDGKVKFHFKKMEMNTKLEKIITPPTAKTSYIGREQFWKGIRKRNEEFRKYMNSKNNGTTVTNTRSENRPDITIEKWND